MVWLGLALGGSGGSAAGYERLPARTHKGIEVERMYRRVGGVQWFLVRRGGVVVGGRANARLALALAANGGEDLVDRLRCAKAADKRALECGGLPSRRRWLCWRLWPLSVAVACVCDDAVKSQVPQGVSKEMGWKEERCRSEAGGGEMGASDWWPMRRCELLQGGVKAGGPEVGLA